MSSSGAADHKCAAEAQQQTVRFDAFQPPNNAHMIFRLFREWARLDLLAAALEQGCDDVRELLRDPSTFLSKCHCCASQWHFQRLDNRRAHADRVRKRPTEWQRSRMHSMMDKQNSPPRSAWRPLPSCRIAIMQCSRWLPPASLGSAATVPFYPMLSGAPNSTAVSANVSVNPKPCMRTGTLPMRSRRQTCRQPQIIVCNCHVPSLL